MIMSEKKLVIFFPMENIFQVLDLTYVAVTSSSPCQVFFAFAFLFLIIQMNFRDFQK